MKHSQRYERIRKTPISQPQPTREQLERWRSQAEKIFAAFYESPKTMYQVYIQTGIERPNICRRVHDLRLAGKIKVTSIDLDVMTGRRAKFLTTNPIYWPHENSGVQINLFE